MLKETDNETPPMRAGLNLPDINPNLMCALCGGYLIDATTVVECLHSFCKSCIVRYLATSDACPICDVKIYKSKSHIHIKPDRTLQSLVYKLVPGLHREEMKRRRKFYLANHSCSDDSDGTSCSRNLDHTLAAGEATDNSDKDKLCPAVTDDDKISICLSHQLGNRMESETSQKRPSQCENWGTQYLLCAGHMTVGVLKKFLRRKFLLDDISKLGDLGQSVCKVDIVLGEEKLDDSYTLSDVAYIFGWDRNSPLQLKFAILSKSRDKGSKRARLDAEAPVLPPTTPSLGDITCLNNGDTAITSLNSSATATAVVECVHKTTSPVATSATAATTSDTCVARIQQTTPGNLSAGGLQATIRMEDKTERSSNLRTLLQVSSSVAGSAGSVNSTLLDADHVGNLTSTATAVSALLLSPSALPSEHCARNNAKKTIAAVSSSPSSEMERVVTFLHSKVKVVTASTTKSSQSSVVVVTSRSHENATTSTSTMEKHQCQLSVVRPASDIIESDTGKMPPSASLSATDKSSKDCVAAVNVIDNIQKMIGSIGVLTSTTNQSGISPSMSDCILQPMSNGRAVGSSKSATTAMGNGVNGGGLKRRISTTPQRRNAVAQQLPTTALPRLCLILPKPAAADVTTADHTDKQSSDNVGNSTSNNFPNGDSRGRNSSNTCVAVLSRQITETVDAATTATSKNQHEDSRNCLSESVTHVLHRQQQQQQTSPTFTSPTNGAVAMATSLATVGNCLHIPANVIATPLRIPAARIKPLVSTEEQSSPLSMAKAAQTQTSPELIAQRKRVNGDGISSSSSNAKKTSVVHSLLHTPSTLTLTFAEQQQQQASLSALKRARLQDPFTGLMSTSVPASVPIAVNSTVSASPTASSIQQQQQQQQQPGAAVAYPATALGPFYQAAIRTPVFFDAAAAQLAALNFYTAAGFGLQPTTGQQRFFLRPAMAGAGGPDMMTTLLQQYPYQPAAAASLMHSLAAAAAAANGVKMVDQHGGVFATSNASPLLLSQQLQQQQDNSGASVSCGMGGGVNHQLPLANGNNTEPGQVLVTMSPSLSMTSQLEVKDAVSDACDGVVDPNGDGYNSPLDMTVKGRIKC